MQELHDNFGSFWIIHAGEMFSWEVTGMCLSPGSSQQHLTLSGWGPGEEYLPGAHGEVGAYGWTKKAIIHDAYSYLL